MPPNLHWYIGIDEAGRGPLAGPVAVGVVKISSEKRNDVFRIFQGIKDSKQLTAKEREIWFSKLIEEKVKGSLDFCVSMSSHKMIDKKGIVRSIKLAMRSALQAVSKIEERPSTYVLLDGSLKAPRTFQFQKTIIKGDQKERIISMASVAAKVLRDRRMVHYAQRYKEYGFHLNKGYGTPFHYKKLLAHGMCDLHRKSFIHLESIDTGITLNSLEIGDSKKEVQK